MAAVRLGEMPGRAPVAGAHVEHAAGGVEGLGASGEALDGVVGSVGEGEVRGVVDADGDLGTAPDGVVEYVGGGVVVVGAGGGGGGVGGRGGHDRRGLQRRGGGRN